MKKILIPVDGSEYSLKALEQAKELMGAFGCQVLLVHAVEGPNLHRRLNLGAPQMEWTKEIFDENDIQDAEKMLQEYKDSFGDKKDQVSTQVLLGFASDEIIKAINESDVDLAIMGSRGIGSTFYRNFMGSVTNKVLHHAEKPILVVR